MSTRRDRWRWLLVEWRPKGWPAWLEWSPKPILPPNSQWHLRLAVARLLGANVGVAVFGFVLSQPFMALYFLIQVNLVALDVRYEWRRRGSSRN